MASLKEFLDAIEYSINKGMRTPIYGGGASGIGKSEGVQGLASRLFGGDNYDGELYADLSAEERKRKGIGDGWVDLRLLLYTETELKGVPFPDDERQFTIWLSNDIFPRVAKDGSRGILILDELPAASKKVKTAIYQLALDRKLGTYTLPDGWFIVALGNRAEDGGEYSEMPAALANRFAIFDVDCTLEDWKENYAYPNHLDESVIAFLNFAKENLHTYSESSPDPRFASPRKWKVVSDLLKSTTGNVPKVVWNLIEANIGDLLTSELRTYVALKDTLVHADTILSGENYNLPSTDQEAFMTLTSIAYAVREFTAGYKSAGDLTDDDKEKLKRAIEFIVRLKEVTATVGFRDIISANPDVVRYFATAMYSSPAFDNFIAKNKELFAKADY